LTEKVQLRGSEETRKAIISTALQLIQEFGPEQFSLREIARRIGYSPAGLYEYFAGKAEIVQAVRRRALEKFLGAMHSVPSDLSSDEYLVQLGLAYIAFANRSPQEFLLLFSHLRGSVNETDIERELSQGSYSYLDQGVRRAIEDGVIRLSADLGDAQVAYSLWALVHGMAMLQVSYLREMSIDYETVDEASLRAMVRGLGSG
jgi:AcrR family transcriptional regulator